VYTVGKVACEPETLPMRQNHKMSNHPLHTFDTFTQDTKAAFLQYLKENPSRHRVSEAEKNNLIQWLVNFGKRPSSQQEFSRRHYARKTFTWDDHTQSLLAFASKTGEKNRTVVTEDKIADVVELVHNRNGHAGWDATWRDIRCSYHGIFRADVIFLLKQCQVCAGNPRKRPKGPVGDVLSYQLNAQDTYDLPSFDDLFSSLDTPKPPV
jgi:hypothetical protein